MLRIPHSLDNQFTDGGEDVSLTRRSRFTPMTITGTHFCKMLARSQGLCAAGKIKKIEKKNQLPHRASNQLIFGFWNSASIKYTTAFHPDFKCTSEIWLHKLIEILRVINWQSMNEIHVDLL
jgi:hypothetical protein